MNWFKRARKWNWWGESVAIVPPAPVSHILEITQEGRKLITDSEGYRSMPYVCAGGVVTIGYGCTIDWDGNPITMDHAPIDKGLATVLFDRDIKIFSDSVRKLVKVNINNNQFSALISLAYNIGVGNFRSSTLLRKLNKGDYAGASDQFQWWRRAKGKILKGLVIRRERERLLFVS